MKKIVAALLLTLVFIPRVINAQRNNISKEDGQLGLMISGVIFLLIAVSVFIYYMRQRDK
ncbi:MAG: hypothetical protein ABJH05_15090 [Fulvivirga sp.]